MKILNFHLFTIVAFHFLVSCQEYQQTSSREQFFLDDMILDKNLISSVRPSDQVGVLAAGGYSIYSSQPWKNGIIPVAFESTVSKSKQDWFMNTARKWSLGTGIWMINRTNEVDYLRVTSSESGCFSEVGSYPGAIRQLNLGTNCWTEAVALHEIGHALGLMHEHQRPDRNSYISIDWQNMDSSIQYAFDLFSTANNSTPYDFESIMHYNQYAFSKNGKATIRTLPAYSSFQSKMGISKISASDRKAISDMYEKSFTDNYAGFSESYYRAQYPDVVELIRTKKYKSGRAHFEKIGCREGRNPNLDFNETAYRRNNPDVQTALNQGNFNGCGFLHFGKLGRREGRKGNYTQ